MATLALTHTGSSRRKATVPFDLLKDGTAEAGGEGAAKAPPMMQIIRSGVIVVGHEVDMGFGVVVHVGFVEGSMSMLAG